MMKPVYMVRKGGRLIIQTSLNCCSLTEGVVIPLDSMIQERAWDYVLKKEGLKYIDEYVKVLMIITDCVFRKKKFSEQDKEQIASRAFIFEDLKFKELLEKIFFLFSGELIDSLVDNDFESIVAKYIKYTDY